jgi:hypothetical protein
VRSPRRPHAEARSAQLARGVGQVGARAPILAPGRPRERRPAGRCLDRRQQDRSVAHHVGGEQRHCRAAARERRRAHDPRRTGDGNERSLGGVVDPPTERVVLDRGRDPQLAAARGRGNPHVPRGGQPRALDEPDDRSGGEPIAQPGEIEFGERPDRSTRS